MRGGIISILSGIYNLGRWAAPIFDFQRNSNAGFVLASKSILNVKSSKSFESS